MKKIIDRFLNIAKDKCLSANELSSLEERLMELLKKKGIINRDGLTVGEIDDYTQCGSDDILGR